MYTPYLNPHKYLALIQNCMFLSFQQSTWRRLCWPEIAQSTHIAWMEELVHFTLQSERCLVGRLKIRCKDIFFDVLFDHVTFGFNFWNFFYFSCDIGFIGKRCERKDAYSSNFIPHRKDYLSAKRNYASFRRRASGQSKSPRHSSRCILGLTHYPC